MSIGQVEMSNARLQVHFDVHQPIELVEFTMAMQSLAHEYQSFLIKRHGAKPSKENHQEARLFITKIEQNCILAELAEAAYIMGSVISVMDQINIFVDFTKNVTAAINFFVDVSKRGAAKAEEIPYSKRQMKRIKDITALIAKNKEGKLGLTALEYEVNEEEKTEKIRAEFDSSTAKAAHEGLIIAERALEVREQADYEQVLMFFHQTNRDDPKASGRTGDKAIITHITERPLSCYILSDLDKQKIRHVLDDSDHNPLYTGFMVDVNVETNPNGKPMAYRVLRVHDVIYDENSEES